MVMIELIKHSFGFTFERQSKAPLEDKRVFDTFALAKAYVDDKNQNAYIGLTISVVADPVTTNNGLYYVSQIADATHDTGVLMKIGNDVTNDITELTEILNTIQANITEIKVKDVDKTPSNGVSLDLDESGKVKANVDLNVLAEKISTKHIVTTTDVTITNAIGDNQKDDTVQSVLERLHARIIGVETSGITSIVEGNGISITNSDSTTPSISIKTAKDSSLNATTNGLDIFWAGF